VPIDLTCQKLNASLDSDKSEITGTPREGIGWIEWIFITVEPVQLVRKLLRPKISKRSRQSAVSQTVQTCIPFLAFPRRPL
jgi:hypothetical protein